MTVANSLRGFLVGHAHIQVVPGGKVDILGGHSNGHSKQESVYVHVYVLSLIVVTNSNYLTKTIVHIYRMSLVNILGGHSKGHSKQNKKNIYVHASYSERFPR
jgi:hypothetical protein